MTIRLPHGGKTVDLVNALRGYEWRNDGFTLGALPTRLGAMHAAYGAPLGIMAPKGSTENAALVLSGDESLPAWHIVLELPPAFPHYLMTRETFDALARAIPHNGMMTIDGRACALSAAYLDVDRLIGEGRTIVDRVHVALLLPYPWNSTANVITIPHGGIVGEGSSS